VIEIPVMIFGQRMNEACRQHTEAIVDRHMHDLFRRLPTLSGFRLRQVCTIQRRMTRYTGRNEAEPHGNRSHPISSS